MSDWPQVSTGRVEIFVRITTYALVAAPLVSVGVGLALSRNILVENPVSVLLAMLLSALLSVCNAMVVRWGVTTIVGRDAAPRRAWFPVVWGLVLVALVAALLTVPDPLAGLSIATAVASVPTSFVPVLSTRQSGMLNLGYLLLAGVLVILLPQITILIVVTFLGSSFALWGTWSTVWMLRVQLALASASEDRAALALADERLRIARDLHDVFGRTLATIAVKSELAYELVRRGRDESAADELVEVRRLARDAGTEVRQVVRGELQTTWEAEIAGARSILAAAGIGCTVSGEEVPIIVADVLAWVVREGVTNVLRHSTATQVTIVTTTGVGPAGHEVQLTVANNGAVRARSSVSDPNTGTGLLAMSTRISNRGGRVETRRDGDWFLLDAIVPLHLESHGETT